MVLARTNMDVPKHGGLSMFMMPIRSPGVTVTPIKLVTGGSHFCRTSSTMSTRPGPAIGGENDGWRVASKLLFHERNMIGGNSLNDHVSSGGEDASGDAIGELAALAKAVGRSDDSYTRQLIGEAVILETLGESAISRINASLRTGRLPESAASILRLMAGLTGYRLREIAMEIAGTQGVMHGADDPAGAYGQRWLGARISTVGGGSQEMQRNGISELSWVCPERQRPIGVCRSARCWPAAASEAEAEAGQVI